MRCVDGGPPEVFAGIDGVEIEGSSAVSDVDYGGREYGDADS
jgi:hypothetical protein